MNLKRRLIFVIVSLTLLSGCGVKQAGNQIENQIGGNQLEANRLETNQKSEVIVTMPTSSEPEAGFNPIYGWGAGEHTHEPLIQSTLVVTDVNLEIAYDLATDIKLSDDGMVYTVTIRDDVFFTDGEQLTADDVAFTYNTCKEESTEIDFTMLESAKAVDTYVVEFYLNQVYSPWPYIMANIGIVPEHAYDAGYGQNPIGSGRYMVTQWTRNEQVVLEANPNYYGEEIKMKKVTILYMDEVNALAAAMSGLADVVHTSPIYTDNGIKGYDLFKAESVDNRGFNLPTIPYDSTLQIGNDVTSDPAIRNAINIGIDRDKIIANVLKGYGSKAYSVCDKMPWYTNNLEVEYDKEAASELLDKNGWVLGEDQIRYKDGRKAEFVLMFNPSDSVRQALAEEVSNQLKEIGILVTTKGASWDVAYEEAMKQPLVWGWGAHSPIELYNLYHRETGSDYARYTPYGSNQVDEIMDQALNARTMDASYDLWKKAQENTDLPFVWLCNVDHLYYVRNGLMLSEQKIHPHGHGMSLINNVDQWEWKDE